MSNTETVAAQSKQINDVCIVCHATADIDQEFQFCKLCLKKKASGLLAVIGVESKLPQEELFPLVEKGLNLFSNEYCKLSGKYTHVPISVIREHIDSTNEYSIPTDYIVVEDSMITLIDKMTHEDYSIKTPH